MRKLKLFFACLLMAVLSIGQMWAEETEYYSYTFTAKQFSDNTTAAELGDITWTPATSWSVGTGYWGYDATKGQQWGSGSHQLTTMTLTAGSSIDNVSKIVVKAAIASSGGCKLSVKVGETTVGSEQTLTTTATDYTFTSESPVSGVVSITLTNSNKKKAQYIKSITIYTNAGGGGGGEEPTACANPTFSPAAGSYEGTQTVTISCSTDGAAIHYTTDGTDPTASSPTYSDALSVSATQTIKAIAMKDGLDDSEIVTATYTITEGPDVTLDLIDGNWGFPTSNTTEDGTYTNSVSGYSVTCHAPTNYKVSGSDYFFIGKSGAYILLPEFSSPIEKIVVSGNSGGAADVAWNIYQGETAVSTAASGCKNDAYTFDIAPANQRANIAHSIKVTNAKNLQIKVIKIYFGEAAAVEAPTISGETPFVTTTTVTLGCTTDGASIYYTTDGTDPSSSSTLYEDPFELNAGATVKAIAILGSDQSSIASKVFEKVTSYSTLAAIFAKADEVGSTATDIYVTFDSWKVSAKTSNNVFLTDGTNGAVIYGSGHGFNAGDVLTGTVACKVQLYKGFAELTALTSGTTGLTVTPGFVGDPVVKTWDQLSAVNTGALVQLENLTYDGSSLSDGVNTIPTYTTFYTATFEAGKSYNLSGVYQYYESAGQILPRSEADVQEILETFTVTYNNAPENGTLTIKNGDDVVTSGSAVNEGTVLDIVTSPAEGYKLAGVTVNGSAYAEATIELTEDITIAASFEENLADPVNSYVLSVIGTETPQSVSGLRVGDKVTLPPTATACSKTFVGWDLASDCSSAPAYAPGAEYTLALDNKLYAVYATPGDNAATEVFATTSLGSTNTVTEGYAVSAVAGAQTGYYQDGGSVGNKRHVQVMVSNTETQIIPSQPSAITVTAKIGGGSTFDALVNPVYAILLNASGEEIGDPVALTSAIEVKEGKDYTVNMATSNYADVRGVRVYHVKENKSGSGFNVRYYSISLSYATESYSDYSTDCQAQVATPTFSPAAGTYTAVQNVEISCETTGATIYYTTNGDEPTASSTLYESAITVDESKTLKAIAVKAGMANSAVASASYTINLPLSTMDQIFAAATAAGSTATDANIAFNNWVVSGVSTNGKNVFVTDGTKGFIIFDNGASMGFSVGDVLSGTVACKVQLYKGAAELTTLSSSTEGLNVATGGVITPAVKAINALSGINTGAAVTINSVQFDGTNLSDGANSIKPYNTLFAYEDLTENSYYNVTGIYQQFDATKEILPRSAADIEEVSLSDPEISYTPASATIELGEDLPGTVFANPHELAISYSSNNEAVATVSNTGVIALGSATGTAVITASFAGNATYAAANVTYTITVNPASVSENVVILAVYDTKYYAMSTNNASSAFTAIAVEYDGTQVTVNSAEDKAAIQWTKKTSGDNTTFQDADSKYMKSADGTSMSLQEAVCNWVWDATGEYYKISGTSRTFFYQSGTGFKNFATSNFNKTGYSDKAQVIAIAAENIIITSKADPQLAYDPTSVTLTVGGAFTPATLNYAEGFDGLTAVTYASNNEGVATVDESGVVSLVTDATGTATITANFPGNTNYLSGSASYTITVNEAGDDLSGTWTRVTSVAAGQRIIIAGTYNAKTMAMGKQNSNNRAAVLSTLDGDVITPGAATKVFTLVDAGEGHFAIQASNGKYLNAAGTGSSNYLKEADDYEAASAKWTITFDENGANIVATSTGNRNVIRYNSSSGSELFSCYAAGGQRAINIYSTSAAPEPAYTDIRTGLTACNYYTVCWPKAMTAIKGGTLWSFAGKDAGMAYLIQEEAPFEAGKPYIIYATAEKLEAVVEGDDAPAGSNNGLYGTLDYMDAAALSTAGATYMLKSNALRPIGTNNHLDANRAYVILDDITGGEPANVPAHKVRKMPMQDQTTTDCELINAAEAPAKMMINGQLFILRGEKKYDATGRLVK